MDVSNNNLSGQVDLWYMAKSSSSQNTYLQTLNASHNYLSSISSLNSLIGLTTLDLQGYTMIKIYKLCDKQGGKTVLVDRTATGRQNGAVQRLFMIKNNWQKTVIFDKNLI